MWYDDTFMSHPSINKDENKARKFIKDTIAEAQKIFCVSGLGIQIDLKVSYYCFLKKRSKTSLNMISR